MATVSAKAQTSAILVPHPDLGDFHQVIESHGQSLVIARDIGNRRSEGQRLVYSGLVLQVSGESAKAIARAEAALRIFPDREDPNADKVLGLLLQRRGQSMR